MGRVKQNVILFTTLAIGAGFIFYGAKVEKHISLEKLQLKNITASLLEELKFQSYHTRRLLSLSGTGGDTEETNISSGNSVNNALKTTENKKDHEVKERTSHNFGVRGKRFARRRKREVPNSKENFAWKFNLNVTRYEKESPETKLKHPFEGQKKKSGKYEKDKHLDMAMYVSGNGPNQSIEELSQAWDSVGNFLRSLFGGNLKELKEKGHDVSLDVSPLPNDTKRSEHSSEFFIEGSGEETQESTDRKGKFILGFFGFGGNEENPPLEGSGELLETQDLNSTSSVFDLQSLNGTKGITDTSNELETNVENQGDNALSTIITTEIHDLEKFVTPSSILKQNSLTTTVNTEMSAKVSSINSISEETFLDFNNCTDCELETSTMVSTDKKEFAENTSTLPVPVSSILIQDVPFTGSPFSDEALKDFCISLLSGMRKSRFVVDFEGSGSFAIDESNISDVTTVDVRVSNVLTDIPRPQSLGFFESLWNRIMGRRVVSVQNENLNGERGARLLNFNNLFSGFGSGRSAEIDEQSKIEFDNLNLSITEEDEEFVLDCETFLKSVQTETRPNIFDLVNPHSVKDVSTELSTGGGTQLNLSEGENVENLTVVEITSNVVDIASQREVFTVIPLIRKTDQSNIVQDQISTNFPASDIHYTTEAENKQPIQEKIVIESGELLEKTTKLEDLVFNEVQEKVQNDSFSIQSLVLENTNESQEVLPTEKFDISFSTFKTEQNIEETHGSDERTFNIFELGSGVEELSEQGSSEFPSNKERFFDGFINFGSGEKETDISTIQNTEKIVKNSQDRSFLPGFNFGSGARELKSSSDDEEKAITSTRSTGSERIFEWNLGSGDREIPELITIQDVNQSVPSFPDTTKSFLETHSLVTESPFSGGRQVILTTSERASVPLETVPPLENFHRKDEISTERNGDQRFLELNTFGSGGGRELSEDLINTEDLNCVDCSPEQNKSLSLVECKDCEIKLFNDSDVFIASEISISKNFTAKELSTDSPSESQACTNCNANSENTIQEEDDSMPTSLSIDRKLMSSTDPSRRGETKDEQNKMNQIEVTTLMVHQPLENAVSNHPSTETDDGTERPFGTTTVENKPRFLGPIFLTGSGEGGLFVDNKGQINLVQEAEFPSQPISQPSPLRRGARLHDSDLPVLSRVQTERVPEVTTIEHRSTTTIELQSTTPREHQKTTETNVDTLEMSTESGIRTLDQPLEIEISTLSIDTNDEIFTNVVTTPVIQKEFIEITLSASTTEHAAQENETVATLTSLNINSRSKATEPPQRFCTSASQCNNTLNERCIFNGPTAMCNCGRSYVRSPETGKCEVPVVLKTSLKLPGEAFHQDFMNKSSERFSKKRVDAINTMWLLLGDDPELFRTVAGVDVSGFEEGSLVIHWELTLTTEGNESIAELIQQVDGELKEAFEDVALLKNLPLNVENAVLLEVSNDIDPCEKSELNYCSENADCIRDETRGFKCLCKGDYLDSSNDMKYPGEVCIVTCLPYYCGDHGQCSLKQNGKRHCSCSSWYFGERCEISGIVVIAGFASLNILLIVIVLFIVCFCRRRRYRQSRFYGQNQIRFQSGEEFGRFIASPRLADTIALDNVGPTKTSKYMAISTPLHKTPAIHLVSPSIVGSSVDYDYDSTFDHTPSLGRESVEGRKMESMLKV